MRFMITAAPDPDAPAGAGDAPVDPDLFAAYMKYNEDMTKAGVLLAAEGLNPAGKSARVGISGGKRAVLDGPFAETKELVGGFYLIECASREEAIAWAMRCPVGLWHDAVLTIHQMTELSDIPPALRELTAQVAPTWFASVTKPR
jgi:hypothetical protein